MRVLHVISSPDARFGGPIMALRGLAKAQARQGLQVAVVATHTREADTGVAERLRQEGVEVRLVGPVSGPLHRHPSLASAVGEALEQADVVHIHGLWEEVQHQAALQAHRREVPFVIRPCGMLDPWSLSQNAWKKKLHMKWRLRRHLNRAGAIHFTSQAERTQVAALGLHPLGIVEPNGVDLKEFEALPAPGSFRRRHPALENRKYFLFLGRVHPRKGLEHLVSALAQLEARDAMLVVVGGDSDGYLGKIQVLAESHGLKERVVATGALYAEERVAALADAALFVLPSEHENFGIAIVEALAAGTPVIVSDQVAIHNDISEAGVGAVVPLDVGALAREMERWLGDDKLRQAAAERARPFVWSRYDWQQIAQRWSGHYDRLIV